MGTAKALRKFNHKGHEGHEGELQRSVKTTALGVTLHADGGGALVVMRRGAKTVCVSTSLPGERVYHLGVFAIFAPGPMFDDVILVAKLDD